mmetsp:Transcript_90988/g.257170  ORF Transcript_90988/g.257170 Transcript_90988/m.257170 type:complete len:222 (-) Transcript_90988:1502-2167(-)
MEKMRPHNRAEEKSEIEGRRGEEEEEKEEAGKGGESPPWASRGAACLHTRRAHPAAEGPRHAPQSVRCRLASLSPSSVAAVGAAPPSASATSPLASRSPSPTAVRQEVGSQAVKPMGLGNRTCEVPSESSLTTVPSLPHASASRAIHLRDREASTADLSSSTEDTRTTRPSSAISSSLSSTSVSAEVGSHATMPLVGNLTCDVPSEGSSRTTMPSCPQTSS